VRFAAHLRVVLVCGGRRCGPCGGGRALFVFRLMFGRKVLISEDVNCARGGCGVTVLRLLFPFALV